MTSPLLTTKLYIPRIRPGLVPRQRLIEQLDAGLRRRLTLISAPAGFGKTTLLSEWAADFGLAPAADRASGAPGSTIQNLKSKIRLAWLSLDEGDSDPARFLAYLIAALQTIEGNIGKDALGALQSPAVGSKNAPLPMEELLTGLVNQVNAVSDDFVLILDDYYLITAQPIHDILAFLLDHLPGNMHLVIATRADPPLPLARLRGRGQLTELRQTDLRFTLDEATEFLNTRMGLGISPGDVAALASRTEGWIAGLQMAAIAMQSRVSMQQGDDVSSFVEAFAGSDRYVLDYLVEEVLQRQPASVQAFLLQTSILDRLTGPLCDAVIGNQEIGKLANRQICKSANLQVGEIANSQAMLEYLERNNLFVVPLDNERQWYRYHHLFADLLRQRLHQSRPSMVPILHGRASVWYEQNGLLAAAIDHALSAGDSEWAAHLIEQAAESAVLRSEVATLQSWVEALPDDLVRTRPLLYVYHAFTLLLSGHPLDAIEARLRDATEADTADSVCGEVAVIRALIAAYQQETSQSIELSRRALKLLPEESLFFRSLVTGYLALNYLYSGDVAAATQAFEEAVRVSRRAGNLTITVLALCHLAELAGIQGRFYEAKAFYEQALDVGSDDQGQRQPIAGLALIGLGQLLEEWNDLKAAKRYFIEGIGLVNNWGEVGAISGYVGLARTKQAQGDEEGARAAIQTAENLAAKFDAMKVDDEYVAVHRARLWIAQGNVEAASHWTEERGLDEHVSLDAPGEEGSGTSAPFNRAHEYILSAQVYIAQGHPDRALESLDPLLQAVETAGWTIFVIKTMILEALAYQAQGEMAQAMTSLARALSLAEPGGLVRTFVREGTPMERLLRQAAAQGIAADYVTGLLTAFEAQPGDEPRMTEPPTSSFVPGPSSLLFDPLTERELEVLRLLTTRLSSTEMAEELFISVNTVRSHIRSIYNKLDVHSRHEAVARAKQLDLL